MSTKDNWDDESSDEEGDAPPSPLKGDAPPGPLYEAQFVDDNDEVPTEDQTDEEYYPEGGAWEDALQEDSDGGVGEDPPDDYYDELDDYDKKLGRYVAVR